MNDLTLQERLQSMDPAMPQTKVEETLDLVEYWNAISKRRWSILGLTVLVSILVENQRVASAEFDQLRRPASPRPASPRPIRTTVPGSGTGVTVTCTPVPAWNESPVAPESP